MSFTSIILITNLVLIIGIIIGFLIKSKSLSFICGGLAIVIFLFGYLVVAGFLTNCG